MAKEIWFNLSDMYRYVRYIFKKNTFNIRVVSKNTRLYWSAIWYNNISGSKVRLRGSEAQA